jgi:acetylornithine aminotransferase/acetylornithine/N-succinyldiaminopimelate aminotransferase
MPKHKKSRSVGSVSSTAVLREADKHLANTYKRPNLVFTHGKGCTLYDHRGRPYLDFLGGIAVNALGYAHPRLVRTIRREAARATHLSNLFHNPFQGPLAAKLTKWSGMDRVFLTNSGAEAIEAAMKLSRAYARAKHGEGKTRFLALENSFHGRTFGAVSLTWPEKYRKPFEPLVPGVEFVRFNDVADLEAKFSDSVCAIFIEPVQGEGGVYPVSEEFWRRARELTSQHGAALVADEIQSGLGRTGRAFAYQKYSGAPDIVTLAKPLAGGLPLGAMLASEEFASAFKPGMHGSTFGGGPLVCAVALEFLNVIDDEQLLANVLARGAELREGLAQLARKFDFITGIRGEGLMVGIQLSIDGSPFVAEALKRGILINCTHETTLRLLPPFIVTRAQIREFLRRMETVFSKTKRAETSITAKVAAASSMSRSHATHTREGAHKGELAAAR